MKLAHGRFFLLLSLFVLFTGCTTVIPGRRADATVDRRNGAIIIQGAALGDGGGSILDAMNGKVPNMRIQRSSKCPEVVLRNAASAGELKNPHVYVDGVRSTDTCILDSIRTTEVTRIEIYPQGFTTRPGYSIYNHGLILIFLRS